MRFGSDRSKIRILGLVEVAAALCLLGSLLGAFGSYHWLLDLFSHFRLQYTVTLGIAAGVFWLTRRPRWAITSTVAAALLGSTILAYRLPHGANNSGPGDLRILSFNLLTSNESYNEVLTLIREEDADLVFLMEINRAWSDKLAEAAATYPHSIDRIREDNFGVLLLSKIPLIDPEILIVGSAPLPTIRTSLEIAGRRIKFIGTHPPPPVGRNGSDARNNQLRELATMIAAETTEPIILAGDLNTTPFSPHFRDFAETSGLLDSASGNGFATTWMPRTPVLAIPLDYVMHSDHFQALDRRVGPRCGSDHRPVIATLEWAPTND